MCKEGECSGVRSAQASIQKKSSFLKGPKIHYREELPILRDDFFASHHYLRVVFRDICHGLSSLLAFHLRDGPALPFAHEAWIGIVHTTQETRLL